MVQIKIIVAFFLFSSAAILPVIMRNLARDYMFNNHWYFVPDVVQCSILSARPMDVDPPSTASGKRKDRSPDEMPQGTGNTADPGQPPRKWINVQLSSLSPSRVSDVALLARRKMRKSSPSSPESQWVVYFYFYGISRLIFSHRIWRGTSSTASGWHTGKSTPAVAGPGEGSGRTRRHGNCHCHEYP